MIVYFADRKMNILGQASTNLLKGIVIKDDTKTQEIETGVAVFECRCFYSQEDRQKMEEWAEAGNYILRNHEDENEFYTIINVEIDTKEQEVYIYAEDAGMDLLNEIVKSSGDGVAHSLKEYIESAAYDSGFEIGINESDDREKVYYALEEQTAAERILEIAGKFGYEISYSFSIDRLEVTHKYIHIYKKRGKDTGVQLRLNREVEKITIKKSVENLATSLLCTGSADASGVNISFDGYQYDDGDFYVSGRYLNSRNALAKWSRYLWHKEPNQINNVGHVVRTFTYDTVSQEELCKKAVEELKKICDIERNYEVQITHLPETIKIGDMLNIVDDAGNLYLQSRLLKLETSVVANTKTATLGDYLLRDDGISEKVEQIAAQFKDLAKNQIFYTWIAYADDPFGNGITLEPDGKDWIGIAENQVEKETNLENPLIYKWSRIGGYTGEAGTPGRVYLLETSSSILKKSQNGDVIPDEITFKASYRDGTESAKTEYQGIFVIEESKDGKTWTKIYESLEIESTLTFPFYNFLEVTTGNYLKTNAGSTIVVSKRNMKDIIYVRCRLYTSDKNTILDEKSIPLVMDVEVLTHEQIFNLLTNNGAIKGIYKEGDQLYISFTYAKGGELGLGGKNNGNGVFKMYDENNNVIGTWDKDGINATEGTFSGKLKGATGTFSGELKAATGTFSGICSNVDNVYTSSLNHGWVEILRNGERTAFMSGRAVYKNNYGMALHGKSIIVFGSPVLGVTDYNEDGGTNIVNVGQTVEVPIVESIEASSDGILKKVYNGKLIFTKGLLTQYVT